VVDPTVPEDSRGKRLPFPEAWVVLVAVPTVVSGLTVARVFSGDEEIPAQWWTGVAAAVALVLGLVGGFVFARVKDLAAIGSSGLVGFYVFALWLGSGARSPSDHDTGNLGSSWPFCLSLPSSRWSRVRGLGPSYVAGYEPRRP
jgi:hypothetical protein